MDTQRYNTSLEPWDWRYSAAIVGIYKYLFFHEKEYNITDDALEFNCEDITEEEYLEFAEYYYGTGFPHKMAEQILDCEELSDNQKKMVNDLLQANSILKKVFKKIKFDGENKDEILHIIDENRLTIVKETYRNKKNMYADFSNINQLFNKGQERCRLLGFYVDGGKKSKSTAYNFNTKSFVGSDTPYFDFIPFAFMGDYESYFINDSYSVVKLIDTNTAFESYLKDAISEIENTGEPSTRSIDAKKILFKSIIEVAEFLRYDVEIICKNREHDFFETMYIRKNSIEILKKMNNYDDYCRKFKVNDNFYIDVQQEVLNCILNSIRTDSLIERYLKAKSGYMVNKLINLNLLICGGGENMKKSMQGAYACAKEVVNRIPENKVDSYRQKLISSVVFRDYDRCCQILLQLSNYSDVKFNFAYDLFEDFETNKDVLYTFINALTNETKVK